MLDLTEGRVDEQLLKFTLPMFISVIFQQLYNIADSLIAGKFAGEDALAAVGASYPVTMILMAVALGTGIGTMVTVSNLFGSKSFRQMKTSISTVFISSLVITILMTILALFLSDKLLVLLNTPENIFLDSKKYLDIYIVGFIFLFFYNVATGIFNSMGDSKTPLYFLIFSSVLNIVLDYIFVRYFNWGVEGVAYATLMAQGLSAILSMAVLWFRLKSLGNEKFEYFSFTALKDISYVAIPSILQQSFISIGNFFIQSRINIFGSSTIAGFAAANKLNTFVITSFTTVGNGVSSFTAQNLGAGKKKRIKDGFFAGYKIVFVIALSFLALFFLKGDYLIGIFLKEKNMETIEIGHEFLKIVSPFYFVSSLMLVSDGVLTGSKSMREFMIVTFVDLFVRVFLAFFISNLFGHIGIWMSWPMGWTTACTVSMYFCRKILKSTSKE